jgi:hypothetical protein
VYGNKSLYNIEDYSRIRPNYNKQVLQDAAKLQHKPYSHIKPLKNVSDYVFMCDLV